MTKNVQTLLVALLLCLLMWGVSTLPVAWAMPEQSGLLQTVPTRTPVLTPATQEPPSHPSETAPPSDASPTPIPEGPDATITPTPTPTATPTLRPTAINTVGPTPTPTGTPRPSTATAVPEATVVSGAATVLGGTPAAGGATPRPTSTGTPLVTATSAPTGSEDLSEEVVSTPGVGSEESPISVGERSGGISWLLVGGIGLALLVAGAVILYLARK